jgi:hypothetical protein
MRQDQDSFAYGKNAGRTGNESIGWLSLKPSQPNAHQRNHPLSYRAQLPLRHVPIDKDEKSSSCYQLQSQGVIKSQRIGQVLQHKQPVVPLYPGRKHV